MFAKVYQYKFGTVAEAKVAASFCSDNLGKKISQYKFQSLNVMIGKDGDLSIFIKFDTIDRLKKYETESDAFLKELNKHLYLKKTNMLVFLFIIMRQRLLRLKSKLPHLQLKAYKMSFDYRVYD